MSYPRNKTNVRMSLKLNTKWTLSKLDPMTNSFVQPSFLSLFMFLWIFFIASALASFNSIIFDSFTEKCSILPWPVRWRFPLRAYAVTATISPFLGHRLYAILHVPCICIVWNSRIASWSFRLFCDLLRISHRWQSMNAIHVSSAQNKQQF